MPLRMTISPGCLLSSPVSGLDRQNLRETAKSCLGCTVNGTEGTLGAFLEGLIDRNEAERLRTTLTGRELWDFFGVRARKGQEILCGGDLVEKIRTGLK